MIGPSFMDEIDCGSFFDHIDDLLDFPAEDVDVPLPTVGNCDSLSNIWNPESDSVFTNNSASHLSAELSVPYEDIVQLEWMSKFVEDSFEGGSLTMKKEDVSSDTNKEESAHQQFHTSSPVSVLESSSSYSGEKPAVYSSDVLAAGRCGRARSKRPRPATFVPRPGIQLISPASSIGESPQLFVSPKASLDSENFPESRPVVRKIPKQVSAQYKKKIKFSVSLAPPEIPQSSTSQAVRKCLHCEITKTPQWRAGPMGPKTLCNACGVRYKSGRLFPEYRPAASPTFVPSIHSNSHKKVLEMRTKSKDNTAVDTNGTDSSEFPELIPNTNSSLTVDYI